MREWRQYGPIGVLFDIIASICTPQTRELLQKLQQVEAELLGKPVVLKELVRPVKTRWNLYFAALTALWNSKVRSTTTLSISSMKIAKMRLLRVAQGALKPVSCR
jgi:hypothetical protein